MEQEVVENYGYEPEKKDRSWFDLIIEYLKSKEQASKPKLEATV
jgi:hypothetical protein